MIKLTDLNPRTAYCIVRDTVMRETIVVHGRTILAEARTSRDFQRFKVADPLWTDTEKIDCGDFFLGVWRDPTRPELNVRAEVQAPVEVVRETVAPDQVVVYQEEELSLAELLEVGAHQAVESFLQ